MKKASILPVMALLSLVPAAAWAGVMIPEDSTREQVITMALDYLDFDDEARWVEPGMGWQVLTITNNKMVNNQVCRDYRIFNSSTQHTDAFTACKSDQAEWIGVTQ